MIKPQMSDIPGVGVMTDTLDFVKNLWGSMNVPGMTIPGMAVPTLSVDELDKKIADLKTVETWLTINMNMLHGTIQALEVQRGTIAAIKAMSANLAQVVKPDSGKGEKSLLDSLTYASSFLFPTASQTPAVETASTPPVAAPRVAAPAPVVEDSAPEDEKPAGFPDFSAQLANPTVWWNILQDQFKQAVNTAIASDTLAKMGAAGTAMATDAVTKIGAAAAKTMQEPASEADKTEEKSTHKKPTKQGEAKAKSKETKD